MGWYSKFDSIKNGIINKLKTVTDIKHITFGERENLGQLSFPCCFVIPGEDEIINSSHGLLNKKHSFNWEIVLVGKNLDIEVGMSNILQVAGKCYDSLTGDFTLGGVADWVDITSVDPGYARADQGTIIEWVVLRVEVWKFSDD